MRGYLARRLILTVPVLLGVSTLVFFFIHLIPGDPVEVMLGETALAVDKEALRHQLQLDRPLPEQYLAFLAGLLRGDLGRSLITRDPVAPWVLATLPATLELAGAAMLVAIALAFPLGILAATHREGPVDHGSMFLALLGVSLPNFVLGPLFIILFAIQLGWLPVSGRAGIASLVLPAVTLGGAMAGILSRMTRASMLEVLGEEYIVVARSKGLAEARVVVRHALRNALVPLMTLLGLQFGALLSGALITETIFAWPGLGRLTIQAIQSRDYPLVQGCVLVIALGYVLVNLVTDMAYGLADPRIRYRP